MNDLIKYTQEEFRGSVAQIMGSTRQKIIEDTTKSCTRILRRTNLVTFLLVTGAFTWPGTEMYKAHRSFEDSLKKAETSSRRDAKEIDALMEDIMKKLEAPPKRPHNRSGHNPHHFLKPAHPKSAHVPKL